MAPCRLSQKPCAADLFYADTLLRQQLLSLSPAITVSLHLGSEENEEGLPIGKVLW